MGRESWNIITCESACPGVNIPRKAAGEGFSAGRQEAHVVAGAWPSVIWGISSSSSEEGRLSRADCQGPFPKLGAEGRLPPNKTGQPRMGKEGLRGKSVPIWGRALAGSAAKLSSRLLIITCPATGPGKALPSRAWHAVSAQYILVECMAGWLAG